MELKNVDINVIWGLAELSLTFSYGGRVIEYNTLALHKILHEALWWYSIGLQSMVFLHLCPSPIFSMYSM